MEWETILTSAIAALVVLSPAAFIWYMNVGGIHQAIKRRKVAKLFEKALSNLTCSVNADCPPGYVCIGGHCVPQKA